MDPSGYCHRKFGAVKVPGRSTSVLPSRLLCSRFAFASVSLPLRFPFLAPSKPHRFAFASLRLTMAPFRYSLRHSLSFAPPSVISSALASVSLLASLSFQIIFSDQALDRLVSPSSIHYCTSTDDLSTLSSSRGLTCSWQWQFFSLGGLHA